MEWATSLRTNGVLPEDALPDDFEQPVRAAAVRAAARRMLIAFFINMLLICFGIV